MSDPPGKKSKKARLLRPFKAIKGLFSSNSSSHQGVQILTPDNETDSTSTTPRNSTSSAPQVNAQSPQAAQSVTPDKPIASISPSNSATTAPQVNPQSTEYMAILGLSTTSSGPLTWEHRMKDWGSTAYEGLKTVIQGVYDCSGIFPPLQTTAGVLLTISKAVDVRGSVLLSKCVINV